ncbi:hypothetical protein [Phyllobacterium lublinensis]|uniref:hypothetical protein n=1 Tax=Phyllobacterium lublinensis TaxID=2875708 RepID=UPI001CCFB84D|nr:hypothetical protein [Phyllobacterium sp. 2063]MBZ9653231.1 hypothetical protein [Phyllobacterium sp. 2063]
MPDQIAAALEPYGLVQRGGFVFDEGNASSLSARGFRSVVLIGHHGSSIWPHFTGWRQDHPDVVDPLDQWSKDVLTAVAAEFDATAVFPSDRPYLPFQQWAIRAENLRPSPLGILIHPLYGLWHAYRGALLFDRVLEFPRNGPQPHPCDDCQGKPCLSRCPVHAFSDGGYDVVRCRGHLASDEGQACLHGGCLARLACPVGREHNYNAPQMRFHMDAFAKG